MVTLSCMSDMDIFWSDSKIFTEKVKCHDRIFWERVSVTKQWQPPLCSPDVTMKHPCNITRINLIYFYHQLHPAYIYYITEDYPQYICYLSCQNIGTFASPYIHTNFPDVKIKITLMNIGYRSKWCHNKNERGGWLLLSTIVEIDTQNWTHGELD